MSYGPALPPGYKAEQSDEETETSDATIQDVGTADGACRPTLPPSMRADDDSCTDTKREQNYGPKLPGQNVSNVIENEEDCVIGPLPIPQHNKDTVEPIYSEEIMEREQRRAEVETRAEQMKNNLSGKGKDEAQGPSREEWMTALPPQVKAFGLGPRKFRTRDVDLGDRSVWTDTPADKLRKKQERVEGEVRKEEKDTTSVYTSARDEKLSAQVSEYNKGCRSEPLMEMHRKRRAEEKDGSEGTRRPFDREVDLKLPQNIITPAKRQALMKDSSTSLKNKFSHGSQRFL